jgi:hypothetical protein
MSWLTTFLAHSCLPGFTSSFLAPSPLPAPYPHPLPLPPPPHRHLVEPWPPVPLLWLVVRSPFRLRQGIDVCSCVVIVYIVARRLGGGVVIWVFVHHQRCRPLLALWHRHPLLALRRHCVHCRPSSASQRRCLWLCCHCCLHCGGVVCIVVCGVIVCIIAVCAIGVCIAGVVGRVCFVLCLCGGGRWCDIPSTWQIMVRTYSNKQRHPSK